MARRRPLIGMSGALCCLWLAACTETLTHETCARYRDRLKEWAQARGKSDSKGLEDFLTKCSGSVVSRRTARCLEQANDEVAFSRCLE